MMELAMELFFTASISLCLAFLFAKFLSAAGSTSSPVGAKLRTEGISRIDEEDEEDRLLIRDSQTDDLVQYLVGESDIMHEFVRESCEAPAYLLEEKTPKEEEVDLIEERSNNDNNIVVEVENREKSEEQELVVEVENSDESEEQEDVVEVENSQESEEQEDGKEEEIVSKDEKIEVSSCEIEEKDEKEVDDYSDDDWEGIEKSVVEEVFSAASKFVASSENSEDLSKLGNDVQMQLYGLHRVAMEGPCHEPPPLALMVSTRAKWNAWQRLGNMSPEVAMEQYVNLLSGGIPGWMGANSEGDHEQGKGNVAPEAGESKREAHEILSIHHQPDSENERKPEELQSHGESSDPKPL